MLHIPQPFLCNPDHMGGMRLGFGAAGLKAVKKEMLTTLCAGRRAEGKAGEDFGDDQQAARQGMTSDVAVL